jgi:hypothetical protein
VNKTLEDDLIVSSDALEHLKKRLPDMSMIDKVDIAARLRAVVKSAGEIDKAIKDDIKKKLKGKNGTVLGDVFKALLTVVSSQRFDVTAFKAAEPDLYQAYLNNQEAERITFEPR